MCVILGYSATVAAGALGAIYILNPILRPIVMMLGFAGVGYVLDYYAGTGFTLSWIGFVAGLGTWLFAVFGPQRNSAKDLTVDDRGMLLSKRFANQLPLLSAGHRFEVPRLIYGTGCFGLLFSFVGTVLGGLWADDSWVAFGAGIPRKTAPS
jgi:hypothetical protein